MPIIDSLLHHANMALGSTFALHDSTAMPIIDSLLHRANMVLGSTFALRDSTVTCLSSIPRCTT
jgi:hypothetical protein